MERMQTDIIVAGGGVAGLAAATAFGAEGFNTICVDPAPPVTDGSEPGADLRTTAFLQPARKVLEAAGIWDRLIPEAMPLEVMRIIDAGGRDGQARIARDFNSADLGDAPFGWNSATGSCGARSSPGCEACLMSISAPVSVSRAWCRARIR